MIRSALLASVLVACWTGDPAKSPAPPRVVGPVNQRFPVAEIQAIRTCTEQGATALVLRLSGAEDGARLELQLAFPQGAPIPRMFIEGRDAEISICAFHGCTASKVRLDELEVGVRARGVYYVAANAGPTYDDTFEATWTGTPWAVRPCPYEMNPP